MHTPVLLNEVISFLNIQPNKIYVDCTLGHGGHASKILSQLDKDGIFIGIEQDESALEIAKKRLKELDKGWRNCYLFCANFLELKDFLKSLKISKITGGIVLDLGTNSAHFDDPSRGFSFKADGPLDMRMDKSNPLTAEHIINKYNEQSLSDIIYKYGEERYSRKIAKRIIEKRTNDGLIKGTMELARLISSCYPKSRSLRIHPATRTFQAIRIEVNKELKNLENFLCFIPELLLPPARLTVISFHSLEDRITKFFLKNNKEFKVLTKKPVIPTDSEIENNPRARSAKLRAAEKINNEKLPEHDQ